MHNDKIDGLCTEVLDIVALDVLTFSVIASRDLQAAVRIAKKVRGVR